MVVARQGEAPAIGWRRWAAQRTRWTRTSSGGCSSQRATGEPRRPEDADLLVVNTCAFIDAAREESIGAVLELAGAKKRGAKLAVTGCLAERYGPELAAAMPEIDKVAGFGVPLPVEEPVRLLSTRRGPQSRVRRPQPAPASAARKPWWRGRVSTC